MDDPISRIEAALKAEPSAGPWTVLPAIAGEQCVARINALEVVPPTGIELARDFIDADYIAACNPVAIRALLDRLKAAEAENIEADATVTRDETVRMLADTLQAVRTERDRLRQIAYDAATSLESISKLAGLAQYMDTMSDIRAYARSRADFARVALENTNAR